MREAAQQSGRAEPRALRNSRVLRRALRRLRVAAPVLAAALAVLALAVLLGKLPWGWGLAGAGAVVSAALLRLPRRPGRASRAARDGGPVALAPEAAALLDAIPDPCLVLDGRAALAFANSRARALFGAAEPGRPIAFALRAPEILDAVAAARTSGAGQVVRFALRAPVERWFEARVSPVRHGRSPHSDLLLISLHDLTEQQRLERMRADFVANASHELRTPLASLLGFIETLQGPARDDAAARERFLPVMRAQAERMTRLVGDLLSLSRIEASVHVRPNARVDLKDVLAHVAESLAPLARDTGVELALEVVPEPLTVLGDRDELVRVFENLVENAIKYGASGKRVVVRAMRTSTPPQAVVAVQDFGPGIPPEHVPRLTERFYRVDPTESRQKGGTGLGLALVKHILTRHRGTLSIESRLREGSTFTVRLDLAPTEAAAS